MMDICAGATERPDNNPRAKNEGGSDKVPRKPALQVKISFAVIVTFVITIIVFRFDCAFDETASNEMVYKYTAR